MAAQLRCFSLYRYATIRDTILLYPVMPFEMFLRVSVKITVHVLAAGCQLSYRAFYGFFFTVYKVDNNINDNKYPKELKYWDT